MGNSPQKLSAIDKSSSSNNTAMTSQHIRSKSTPVHSLASPSVNPAIIQRIHLLQRSAMHHPPTNEPSAQNQQAIDAQLQQHILLPPTTTSLPRGRSLPHNNSSSFPTRPPPTASIIQQSPSLNHNQLQQYQQRIAPIHPLHNPSPSQSYTYQPTSQIQATVQNLNTSSLLGVPLQTNKMNSSQQTDLNKLVTNSISATTTATSPFTQSLAPSSSFDTTTSSNNNRSYYMLNGKICLSEYSAHLSDQHPHNQHSNSDSHLHQDHSIFQQEQRSSIQGSTTTTQLLSSSRSLSSLAASLTSHSLQKSSHSQRKQSSSPTNNSTLPQVSSSLLLDQIISHSQHLQSLTKHSHSRDKQNETKPPLLCSSQRLTSSPNCCASTSNPVSMHSQISDYHQIKSKPPPIPFRRATLLAHSEKHPPSTLAALPTKVEDSQKIAPRKLDFTEQLKSSRDSLKRGEHFQLMKTAVTEQTTTTATTEATAAAAAVIVSSSTTLRSAINLSSSDVSESPIKLITAARTVNHSTAAATRARVSDVTEQEAGYHKTFMPSSSNSRTVNQRSNSSSISPVTYSDINKDSLSVVSRENDTYSDISSFKIKIPESIQSASMMINQQPPPPNSTTASATSTVTQLPPLRKVSIGDLDSVRIASAQTNPISQLTPSSQLLHESLLRSPSTSSNYHSTANNNINNNKSHLTYSFAQQHPSSHASSYNSSPIAINVLPPSLTVAATASTGTIVKRFILKIDSTKKTVTSSEDTNQPRQLAPESLNQSRRRLAMLDVFQTEEAELERLSTDHSYQPLPPPQPNMPSLLQSDLKSSISCCLSERTSAKKSRIKIYHDKIEHVSVADLASHTSDLILYKLDEDLNALIPVLIDQTAKLCCDDNRYHQPEVTHVAAASLDFSTVGLNSYLQTSSSDTYRQTADLDTLVLREGYRNRQAAVTVTMATGINAAAVDGESSDKRGGDKLTRILTPNKSLSTTNNNSSSKKKLHLASSHQGGGGGYQHLFEKRLKVTHPSGLRHSIHSISTDSSRLDLNAGNNINHGGCKNNSHQEKS